jgi:Ca2+/Na+ antiporter
MKKGVFVSTLLGVTLLSECTVLPEMVDTEMLATENIFFVSDRNFLGACIQMLILI